MYDPTARHGRRRRAYTYLLALVLLGLAVALAGLAGAGATSPSVSSKQKPEKPARSEPAKKALVSALGERVDIVGAAESGEAAVPVSEGDGIPGAAGATTLVLYDTTGAYGWLGELYATGIANLVSHFGSWKAMPVSQYQAGDVGRFTATVYVGSTYDEPLPAAFLDDVYTASRPVVWIYDNIWELTNRYAATFQDRYGWSWWRFDTSAVARVDYSGVPLTRNAVDNGAGIMDYSFLDPAKATVLATAVRADGSTFPWGVRSGNLTYLGENPFPYTSETDRLIAFEDILFDVLDPGAAARHRALVRLEDVSPATDAAGLKRCVDYLYGLGIPFGFGVTPVYTDPLAAEHKRPTTIRLRDSEIAALVAYMQARGGTLIEHGYTHQFSNVRNPYNGVTGDDFEFYRVTENADGTLTYHGPVSGDSLDWARARIDAAGQELAAAGAGTPRIFEFPHYAASVQDYRAVADRFDTRWERALYFGASPAGGTIDYGHVIGQLFPYVVRDLYGDVVLPENVGNYEPEPFYSYPVHTVADILDGAARNMAVRDGFASFYYHSTYDRGPLAQIVEGLLAQGWTFADPGALAGVPASEAPANVTPPAISGTARVGQTLTASPGTWSGDPAPAFTFQWLRCDAGGNACTTAGYGSSGTFVLKGRDQGSRIRVRVTATNVAGSATATSAPTPIVGKR